MKKTLKKSLNLILAIAMIASLLPTISIIATAAPPDLSRTAVYTFAEGNIARDPTVLAYAPVGTPGIHASYSNTTNGIPTIQVPRINDGLIPTGTTPTNGWNCWGAVGSVDAEGNTKTGTVYVTITWAQPHTINATRIQYWLDTGDTPMTPNPVFLEYWDGATWIRINNMTDTAGNPVTSIPRAGTPANTVWNGVTLDAPVTTTRLRVHSTLNNVGNGWGIKEWEVFGIAGDPELRAVTISGEAAPLVGTTNTYTAIVSDPGLEGVTYKWTATGNVRIVGSDSGRTVSVEALNVGAGTLTCVVTHDTGVLEATAYFDITVRTLTALDHIGATAAGRAPILPNRVVVDGLRFDTPTATTTGGFNFGEEFEQSLIPVVWDMSSFTQADYAADKIGTSFIVTGVTADGSRAPGLPARAIFTVNQPLAAPDYNHSITSENVIFDDVFWAPKQLVNATTTFDHAVAMLESTAGNRFAVQNFRNSITRLQSIWDGNNNPPAPVYNGYVFQDTDVYKTLEGFAYTLAAKWDDPDFASQREDRLDKVKEWIELIETVQYADGYVTTTFSSRSNTTAGGGGNSQHRWRFFARHEMYNIGHLLEAAVAYTRFSVGVGLYDYSLYEVGRRAADHIVDVFGPDGYRMEVPGHQQIELALMKFAKLCEEYEGAGTGQKYRDTVEALIHRRGRRTGAYTRQSGYYGGTYSQDSTPLVYETQAVGHSVRAMYYYTGATDIAIALPEDNPNKIDFLTGINNIYASVSERNTYITGGLGSGETSEGFGEDWRLRNVNAYTETCAAIAGANWYQRLNLYYEDAKFADAYERALYNGALVGVSLNGNRFYYACYLDSGSHARSEWFACACCPPNLIRTIANIGGYMYTVNRDKVFVNLFGRSTGNINVQGNNVVIRQETNYPWEGFVRFTVTPPANKVFTLNLRVPGWLQAQKYQQCTLIIDGVEYDATPNDKGYIAITREWAATGTVIDYDIPIEVRFTEADENVSRVYNDFSQAFNSPGQSNKIVVERGPIVYQLETASVPLTATTGRDARQVFIPRDMEYTETWRPDLLRGVVEITGYARYATDTGERNQFIQLIPYYAKNNRGNNPSNLGSSDINPNNSSSSKVWINSTEMDVQIRGDKNRLAIGGVARLVANPKVNFNDMAVPDNFVWTVISGEGVIEMLGAPAAGRTDDSGPGKIGGLNFTRPTSIATYKALGEGTAIVRVDMRNSNNEIVASDTYTITVEAEEQIPEPEPITRLRINLNAITRLPRNGKQAVTITVNEGASTEGVILTTSNPTMATIAADGRTVITQARAGTVTLTASDPETGLRHSVTLMIT